jgi:hypothetical protein
LTWFIHKLNPATWRFDDTSCAPVSEDVNPMTTGPSWDAALGPQADIVIPIKTRIVKILNSERFIDASFFGEMD